jgi:hypothetical protein
MTPINSAVASSSLPPNLLRKVLKLWKLFPIDGIIFKKFILKFKIARDKESAHSIENPAVDVFSLPPIFLRIRQASEALSYVAGMCL